MMKKNSFNLIMLILVTIITTIAKLQFIDGINLESSNPIMANMLFYWCNNIIVNLIWVSLILTMVFTITDYVYSELIGFNVRYYNRKNMLVNKMKEMIILTFVETIIVGMIVAIKGINLVVFLEFYLFILFLSLSTIMIAILLDNYIYSFIIVFGMMILVLIVKTQFFRDYVFLNLFKSLLFSILSIVELMIIYKIWTKKDVL